MVEKIKTKFTTRQTRLLVSFILALLISFGAKYIPHEYRDAVVFIVEEDGDIQGEREVDEDDTVGEEVVAPFIQVVRVVDGDTFVVLQEEKEVKVRLIGVDTPESVDPRKKAECFGKEAQMFLQILIEGKLVRLESDTTQTDMDVYGRLLRYVYTSDGHFVNDKLIREGYAHEYTYKVPYIKQLQFKQAQNEAREEERGLWAPGVCI